MRLPIIFTLFLLLLHCYSAEPISGNEMEREKYYQLYKVPCEITLDGKKGEILKLFLIFRNHESYFLSFFIEVNIRSTPLNNSNILSGEVRAKFRGAEQKEFNYDFREMSNETCKGLISFLTRCEVYSLPYVMKSDQLDHKLGITDPHGRVSSTILLDIQTKEKLFSVQRGAGRSVVMDKITEYFDKLLKETLKIDEKEFKKINGVEE